MTCKECSHYEVCQHHRDAGEHFEINVQKFGCKLFEDKSGAFKKWTMLAEKTKSYYAELYQDAKSAVREEAIREFAEALKNKVSVDLSCGVDSADYLDNVLFKDIDRLVEEISKQ